MHKNLYSNYVSQIKSDYSQSKKASNHLFKKILIEIIYILLFLEKVHSGNTPLINSEYLILIEVVSGSS